MSADNIDSLVGEPVGLQEAAAPAGTSPLSVLEFLIKHNLNTRQYRILLENQLVRGEDGKVTDSSAFDKLIEGRAVFHPTEFAAVCYESGRLTFDAFFSIKTGLLEEAGLFMHIGSKNSKNWFSLYRTDNASWSRFLEIMKLEPSTKQPLPTLSAYLFDWAEPVVLPREQFAEEKKISSAALETLVNLGVIRTRDDGELLLPQDFWNRIRDKEVLHPLAIRTFLNGKGKKLTSVNFHQHWRKRLTILTSKGLIYEFGFPGSNQNVYFSNPLKFQSIADIITADTITFPQLRRGHAFTFTELKAEFTKKYGMPSGAYKHFLCTKLIAVTSAGIRTTPAFDSLMEGRRFLNHAELREVLHRVEPSLNPNSSAYRTRFAKRRDALEASGHIMRIGNTSYFLYSPNHLEDILRILSRGQHSSPATIKSAIKPAPPRLRAGAVKASFMAEYGLPPSAYSSLVKSSLIIVNDGAIKTTSGFEDLMNGRKVIVSSEFQEALAERNPAFNSILRYKARFSRRLPELIGSGYVQKIPGSNFFVYSVEHLEDILEIMLQGKRKLPKASKPSSRPAGAKHKTLPTVEDVLREDDAAPVEPDGKIYPDDFSASSASIADEEFPPDVDLGGEEISDLVGETPAVAEESYIETVSYGSAARELGVSEDVVKHLLSLAILAGADHRIVANSLMDFAKGVRGKQFSIGCVSSELEPIVEYLEEKGLLQRSKATELGRLYAWKIIDSELMAELLQPSQQRDSDWRLIIDEYLASSVYERAVRRKNLGMPPFDKGSVIIYHLSNPDFIRQLEEGGVTGVYHPYLRATGKFRGIEGAQITLDFSGMPDKFKAAFQDPANVVYALDSASYDPTIWGIHSKATLA